MKKNIFIIILISSSYMYSQQKRDTVRTAYIPLKVYKEKYKKPLTKNDSLNFIIRDNDTLVQVKNYTRPKGTSVPYEYKDSTFLYYYKKVAFNDKNDSLSKKREMKYWKSDIKIFFSKSVSKKTRKELMEFAESIDSQVDSLNISEVKKVENSNYIVYYFGDFDYDPRMTNYKKTSYYMYWKNNKIYRCTIKLDAEKYFSEKLRLDKLKEYFVQTLGQFYHINDFTCESYFSNCFSENKKLTTLDIELIKYHYSYGICKGTSLETFEEQHKRAKEILKKHNHKMLFLHLE